MKFSPLGAPRLGESAGQELPLIVSWPLILLRNAPVFSLGQQNWLKFPKQDQSRILAQIFLLAWKTFGGNLLARPNSQLRGRLSSTARVNVAPAVHFHCKAIVNRRRMTAAWIIESAALS
jgi:hypothetical protein